MIKNLATIDIARNFPGQKICLKKLEKCKENIDMKEQNKTTAILVWLNKFNKKYQNLNGLNKKKYLTEILLIFEKMLFWLHHSRMTNAECFLQSCWVIKCFTISFHVEHKVLIAIYWNQKSPPFNHKFIYYD